MCDVQLKISRTFRRVQFDLIYIDPKLKDIYQYPSSLRTSGQIRWTLYSKDSRHDCKGVNFSENLAANCNNVFEMEDQMVEKYVEWYCN
jgi:hypothetical protein